MKLLGACERRYYLPLSNLLRGVELSIHTKTPNILYMMLCVVILRTALLSEFYPLFYQSNYQFP